MDTSLIRVDLSGEGKALVLLPRLARLCLLFAANVHARRIDFIVTLRLEVVKVLSELVKLCDTCSTRLIRASGALVMMFVIIDLWSVPNVIKPRITRSLGFCARSGIFSVCAACVTVRRRDYRVKGSRLPSLSPARCDDDSGVPRSDMKTRIPDISNTTFPNTFFTFPLHPAMFAQTRRITIKKRPINTRSCQAVMQQPEP